MSTLLSEDEEFVSTLQPCIDTLQLLADSELPSPLDRHIRRLSENKEFLSEAEREELSALVDFWRKRAVEKLGAQVALKGLRDKFPSLFGS